MSQRIDSTTSDTVSTATPANICGNSCEWCAKPCSQQCSKCNRMRVCSPECMKRLWPTHKYICNKHTQAMLDPTMALMYAMDDAVYAASLVRLGNDDGERPDFWLVLPDIGRQLLMQYMDVKTMCRTDSIMTNVLAREAWYEALRGTPSVSLSKWPRYSSMDKFKSLRWSMNRRVALHGINLWKVKDNNGRVITDVGQEFPGQQFLVLLEQPKFVDIAVMLVKSRSIDANIEIPAGDVKLYPLYMASQEGHAPAVQALLQGGADVDKARDDGITPLFVASENSHVPAVQALLQGGADVDKAMDGGVTPLYMASQEGHVPVVQALLQGGADVDKAADSGATALFVASQNGHLPVVRALLQAVADVNKAQNDGCTPLYIASHDGHVLVVQALLQGGADVDKAEKDGCTPLYIASQMCHTDIVRLLENVAQQAPSAP